MADLPALSATPDLPVPFGYKIGWFAIASEDTAAIAAALSLANTTAANWESGLGQCRKAPITAPQQPVFISPPVDGWSLAISRNLFEASSQQLVDNLVQLLASLSGLFGEVQYFDNHRVADYVAWFRAKNGNIERGFSFVGSDGIFPVNIGPATDVECDFGYDVYNGLSAEEVTETFWQNVEDDPDHEFPNEETCHHVAADWSLSPLSLPRPDDAKGVGLIGYLSKA